MQQSSDNSPRNFRVEIVKMSATYAGTFHDVLSRQYGPLRNATKILARLAGVSPRTSANWMQGLCAPQGEQLFALMAADPIIKAEMMAFLEQRISRAETALQRMQETRENDAARTARYARQPAADDGSHA